MQCYEYKVVAAPTRGEKARGVKATSDRFALALTHFMNELGAEGWDYVRTDALPCEERVGLTGTRTTFQNMMVFRRVLAGAAGQAEEVVAAVAAPVISVPVVAPAALPAPEAKPAAATVAAPTVHWPEPTSAPTLGAARRDLAAE